jgi:pSer/pThr/pTyr-binding forkhead associated (FHA) protein
MRKTVALFRIPGILDVLSGSRELLSSRRNSPPMDVRLVVENGRTRTREVHLSSRETLVGRQRGCEVRIPSSEVSRRHCVLRIENGYLTIEDLRSVNGTFLNGSRVVSREIVRPGDHLEVGPVRFVVEYELSQQALDQISRLAQPAYVEAVEPVEEVLEVAELVEPPPQGDVLELADEVNEFLPSQEVQPQTAKGSEFELGDADQWYLPPADELRDILSQLDDPGPAPKKHR